MSLKAALRWLLSKLVGQKDRRPRTFDVEAAIQQMVADLQTMPKLDTISRVAIARGTTLGQGITVFLETTPVVNRLLRGLHPYEYPGGLWASVTMMLSYTMKIRQDAKLKLIACELAAMTVQPKEFDELGLTIDETRSVLRVPAEALTNPHPWGVWLASQAWFDPQEHAAGVQLCFTPTLDPSKLDEQLCQLLVDLSYGWNYSRSMTPEARSTLITRLCESMERAQLI